MFLPDFYDIENLLQFGTYTARWRCFSSGQALFGMVTGMPVNIRTGDGYTALDLVGQRLTAGVLRLAGGSASGLPLLRSCI